MERLTAARAHLWATLTRVINGIQEKLAAGDASVHDLEERLEFISLKEAALNEVHRQIIGQVDTSSFNNEMDAQLQYEEKINDAKYRLRTELRNRSTAAPSPTPQAVSGERRSAQSSLRTVALPKLQIPTFAGETSTWTSFWDHFAATIHNNPELPKIEKFKYLLSYLTGAARRAVECITLAEHNYDRIIAILT